jgi:succinoglycan biosynthesis protein ExoV
MRLYAYEGENFGDAMNHWLWPRLLPGFLDDDPRSIFIGIGSLLNARVPAARYKVVFGSGVGYGRRLNRLDSTWTVYCVRGPLSAEALGLPPELAVTDPAALIATIELPPEPAKHAVSFMPHWRSAVYWDWNGVCAAAGIHYISPQRPFEEVLREIRSSRLLICEAMHGAIVADALRIPWVPVRAYKHILAFKWWDWCRSLGMAYHPVRLLPLYARQPAVTRLRGRLAGRRDGPLKRAALQLATFGLERSGDRLPRAMAARNAATLERLARTAAPQLSPPDRLAEATGRLVDRLERLRLDHAGGRFALQPDPGASPFGNRRPSAAR